MPAGGAPGPQQQTYAGVVGNGAQYAGVDQGVDFTGAFDVYAIADAVVTRVVRGGSGWPGEGAVVNYRITSGPRAGSYVYVAEDFAPAASLRVGQAVKKGQTIGRATGSGKAPGIEIGWAQPSGIPTAPLPPPRPANQQTTQGFDFFHFITGSAVEGGGGPTGADVNAAARHIPGVAQTESVIGAVDTVGKFLGRVTDPAYILRGLQIVAGAVLVLVGVVLLTRQVALANDLPDPIAAGASKVTRVPLPGTNRDIYQRGE